MRHPHHLSSHPVRGAPAQDPRRRAAGRRRFLLVFGTAVFFADAELARNGNTFLEHQAVLMLLTLAGLYAGNFLGALLAVLLPVDALSGEIDSGVMQTLAVKPIRRAESCSGNGRVIGCSRSRI